MSINVEVINNTEVKWDYPCLGVSDPGLVVLFSEKSQGMVMSGHDIWSFGDFGSSWAMNSFSSFKGSITLTNGENK
jgi:hypothetical protein